MNYATGETVNLGDKVCLGDDAEGVVVILVDTGEYNSGYPKSH
jgi:hypothetical protein